MRPAAMPSRAASRFILLLMIAAVVVLVDLVNLGRTRLAVDE
jgi:hypothetical protein